MILICKLLIVLLAGLLAALMVSRIISIISLMARSERRHSRMDIRSAVKKHLDKSLSILRENHRSKAARKVKLFVSSIVALLSLILTGKIIFTLIAGIALYFLLDAYFENEKARKIALFDDQLIEALGVITTSVTSGQSLMQSLEHTAGNLSGAFSLELEETLKEVRLGKPLDESLIGMTKRIDSRDLNITVTAINLAKETGGNLGEILLRLSHTMKERRKIRGKITALTAQGKASGMVMSAVPFLLLLVLYAMEPAMVGLLFTTFAGNLMLAAVICMVGLGMFFIKRIIHIDI